jgi:hypothetical protein
MQIASRARRGPATIPGMEPQPVDVLCYSGYVGDEEPRAVVVEGRRLDVVAIDRRWREPEARGFVVRLSDGSKHVLRQEVSGGRWTLES